MRSSLVGNYFLCNIFFNSVIWICKICKQSHQLKVKLIYAFNSSSQIEENQTLNKNPLSIFKSFKTVKINLITIKMNSTIKNWDLTVEIGCLGESSNYILVEKHLDLNKNKEKAEVPVCPTGSWRHRGLSLAERPSVSGSDPPPCWRRPLQSNEASPHKDNKSSCWKHESRRHQEDPELSCTGPRRTRAWTRTREDGGHVWNPPPPQITNK